MGKKEVIGRLEAIGNSLDAYYFNHCRDEDEEVPVEIRLASANTMLRAIRSLCKIK